MSFKLFISHDKFDRAIASTHFKPSEFVCPCCRKLSGQFSGMDPVLIYNLELLRSYFKDKPVHITSGYRCSKYNSKLKGSSPSSKHMTGQAADLYIKGVSSDAIIRWWQNHVVGGYAYTNDSNMRGAVHVEVRI